MSKGKGMIKFITMKNYLRSLDSPILIGQPKYTHTVKMWRQVERQFFFLRHEKVPENTKSTISRMYRQQREWGYIKAFTIRKAKITFMWEKSYKRPTHNDLHLLMRWEHLKLKLPKNKILLT